MPRKNQDKAAGAAQRQLHRPQAALPSHSDNAVHAAKPQRPLPASAPDVPRKGARQAGSALQDKFDALEVVGVKIGCVRPPSAGRLLQAGRRHVPQPSILDRIRHVPEGLPPIAVPQHAQYRAGQQAVAPNLAPVSPPQVQRYHPHACSPPDYDQREALRQGVHRAGPPHARSPLAVMGQAYPDDYWGDFFNCRTPAASPMKSADMWAMLHEVSPKFAVRRPEGKVVTPMSLANTSVYQRTPFSMMCGYGWSPQLPAPAGCSLRRKALHNVHQEQGAAHEAPAHAHPSHDPHQMRAHSHHSTSHAYLYDHLPTQHQEASCSQPCRHGLSSTAVQLQAPLQTPGCAQAQAHLVHHTHHQATGRACYSPAHHTPSYAVAAVPQQERRAASHDHRIQSSSPLEPEGCWATPPSSSHGSRYSCSPPVPGRPQCYSPSKYTPTPSPSQAEAQLAWVQPQHLSPVKPQLVAPEAVHSAQQYKSTPTHTPAICPPPTTSSSTPIYAAGSTAVPCTTSCYGYGVLLPQGASCNESKGCESAYCTPNSSEQVYRKPPLSPVSAPSSTHSHTHAGSSSGMPTPVYLAAMRSATPAAASSSSSLPDSSAQGSAASTLQPEQLWGHTGRSNSPHEMHTCGSAQISPTPASSARPSRFAAQAAAQAAAAQAAAVEMAAAASCSMAEVEVSEQELGRISCLATSSLTSIAPSRVKATLYRPLPALEDAGDGSKRPPLLDTAHATRKLYRSLYRENDEAVAAGKPASAGKYNREQDEDDGFCYLPTEQQQQQRGGTKPPTPELYGAAAHTVVQDAIGVIRQRKRWLVPQQL